MLSLSKQHCQFVPFWNILMEGCFVSQSKSLKNYCLRKFCIDFSAKIEIIARLFFYMSARREGQDIVRKHAESKWGTGFFNQLSLDMRKMFPDETGFSVTNLKYMKRWYLYYFEQCQKCREITDGSDNPIRQRTIDENATEENSIEDYQEIRQRPVDELEMTAIFGRIPWGHHIDIISRCKTMEEALFYIRSIVENGWSRPSLNTHIDNHFFQAQGSAITNFEKALPSRISRKPCRHPRADWRQKF